MEILPYEPAFREQCLAIFTSNQPKFFAAEEKVLFEKWLDHSTATNYYVITYKGTVVACGGIFYDSKANEGGLSWGMVHAGFHRHGIGKHFTNYRLALLLSRFPEAVIRIETSQHTKAFYEKLGFRTVSMVPDGFGAGLDIYNMHYTPA